MAARHQLQFLKNHPRLQRFLITNARPTGRHLGAGSYGSVEELEVSGVVCAGKKIHEILIKQGNFGTDNIVSRYVEECQLMSDLGHPHLVQFLGVCFLPDSTLPVLVMERLLTSLDELLEHNPDIPLSLKRSILADVARGLVYLHNHSPPVIHRDLSAKNVLLNSVMVAKIADLGNARIVNFQPGQLARTLSRIPGTMVYMPPEAFEATSKYGPSLDSFSFGHLSLFTITQVFPGTLLQYTFRDPENPRHRLARTEVQRRDEYIKLLHQQLGEQHTLVLLVKQCLDDEPSERPSAQELLRQLEGMRAQIEDPYQRLTREKVIRTLKEKYQSESPGLHTQKVLDSKLKLAGLQTEIKQSLALPSKHEGVLQEKHTGDVRVWSAGTEVVGKYNFSGSAAGELPFKHGDTLTIISKFKDADWYKARRFDGLEGMIPRNYVQTIDDLSSSITSSPASSATKTSAAAISSVPCTRPWTVKKEVTEATGLQDGAKVVGKYDFPRSAAHDLPFKRGDTLTIICKSMDPNWYKARRFDGLEGMIPYNYVQAIDDALPIASSTASSATHTGPICAVKMQSMLWYHGDITRDSAEKLLIQKPYKNGKFLVRKSHNYRGHYTLSVSFGKKVEHYQIQRNEKSWVTVDGVEWFENLVKLVEHHQRDADTLCFLLMHPVEKKSDSIECTVSVQDFKERGFAIPNDRIQKEISIEKGTIKDVWLGKYQGQKVAITTAKDRRDLKTSQQLLAEAAVMTELRHPNLVCLIGVTLDKPPICLITEYMAKGSLLEYLRSQRSAKISKLTLLNFARDICSGMVYIETQNFVHRNLSARNVLIGDDNTAKISNFRHTRDVYLTTEQVQLPIRWTAPEVFREHQYSNKSDVWSFGILLWEIYSYGRVPYPQVNIGDVLNRVERGHRMDVPDGCPDGIYEIMKECWDKDASARPSFASNERKLRNISVQL